MPHVFGFLADLFYIGIQIGLASSLSRGNLTLIPLDYHPLSQLNSTLFFCACRITHCYIYLHLSFCQFDLRFHGNAHLIMIGN